MKDENYRPISCDFHSELELLALRRSTVEIHYHSGHDGAEALDQAPILDIFTRNGEEFLLLPGQKEIRLDHLISVNGLKLVDFC